MAHHAGGRGVGVGGGPLKGLSLQPAREATSVDICLVSKPAEQLSPSSEEGLGRGRCALTPAGVSYPGWDRGTSRLVGSQTQAEPVLLQ